MCVWTRWLCSSHYTKNWSRLDIGCWEHRAIIMSQSWPMFWFYNSKCFLIFIYFQCMHANACMWCGVSVGVRRSPGDQAQVPSLGRLSFSHWTCDYKGRECGRSYRIQNAELCLEPFQSRNMASHTHRDTHTTMAPKYKKQMLIDRIKEIKIKRHNSKGLQCSSKDGQINWKKIRQYWI